LVLALADWLGVHVPCRSEAPGVHTAIFSRPDQPPVIVAVNNGDEPKAAVIRLWDGRTITVDLPAKDGKIVEVPKPVKPA
jgi:hypothetical protein